MPELLDALERHFGFSSFRPGQQEAVRAAMEGRDVLMVMPTGAGKSLCYQLPALLRDELTIVVSPLVSLMADQVAGLERAAAGRAALINSQRDLADNREALARVRGGEVRLLYVAPERFASAGFVEALEGTRVGMFVVDEAHCISQWGHDFRPDYFELPAAARALGARQLFACTATATPRVAGDVLVRLGLRDAVRVTTGFDRPNLSYLVVRSTNDADRQQRIAAVLARPGGASGDRLRGHARAHRGARGLARTDARRAYRRLPRGPRARRTRRGAAALHGRRGRDRRRDQRVRHGHRQARRADGLPRRGAGVARGLLPGGRARGARRAPGALPAVRGRARQGPARPLHQPVRGGEARDARWAQYRGIWAFAEGESCRRVAIQRHFGDRAQPSVAEGVPCCDVCNPEALPPAPLFRVAATPGRAGARRAAARAVGADTAPAGVELDRAIVELVVSARPAVGPHARRRDPPRRALQGRRPERL